MNEPAATTVLTEEDRAQARGLLHLHDGMRAIPYLVARGERIVPLLEPLLRGPPETIFEPRCRIAHTLGRIGGAGATDALVRALRDALQRKLDPVLEAAEAAVINCIADSLGRLQAASARDVLLHALEQHAYAGVIRALADLNETRAIPWIVPTLNDDVARDTAIFALRRFGAAAVPALIAYLANRVDRSADRGRAAAARLLAALAGRSAIAPLRTALRDPAPRVRLAAALALADLVREPVAASEIVPLLIAFLDDDDADVAETSMEGLWRLRAWSEPVLREALEADAHGHVAVRRVQRIIALLEKMGSPAALEAIDRLHASPDVRVRFRVLSALTRMHLAGDAVRIAAFLRDPSPLLQEYAVDALRERDAAGAAELIRTLPTAHRRLRRRIRASLTQMQRPVAAGVGASAVTRALRWWRGVRRAIRPARRRTPEQRGIDAQ